MPLQRCLWVPWSQKTSGGENRGLFWGPYRTEKCRIIGLLPFSSQNRPKDGTENVRRGVVASAVNPVSCGEKEKATCDESQVALGGGGGNRTRVPRYFRGSFYVCSRFFESRSPSPNRHGLGRTSRARSLTTGVPGMASREPDLATDFWASPVKARSRDYLLLGSQDEVFLGT